MIKVLLLLGGNVGSVESTFEGVRGDLEREVGAIVSCSELLESQAWGFDSAPFLNQGVAVTTSLDPLSLLDSTQRIEERWGRNRAKEREQKGRSGERYLAREIDIDIIFYGDTIMQSERLTLPHPLVAQREFALEPLAQIAPEATHPVSGKSVAQMLNELKSER